jgi:hypothetical protein
MDEMSFDHIYRIFIPVTTLNDFFRDKDRWNADLDRVHGYAAICRRQSRDLFKYHRRIT